jgi:hypothetical protein
MTGALLTGYGVWTPAVWILVMIVALFFSYLIRRCGEDDYDEGTEQTKPYLSGNDEPSKSGVHIRGGNLYWGFTAALKGYYDRLIPLHSGIVNDYVSWFLIGLLAVFVVVVLL